MPPSAVVDAVLTPDPAWLPCSGTWHRVALSDGSLAALDHGEIDLVAERTAAALTGEQLHGCVAAVADWASRASRVRLTWLDALASFDAAAAWGADVLPARDAWIEARVTPSLLVSAPMADQELLQWVRWTRDVGQMRAWKSIGWTSWEACRLSGLGLSSEESVDWRHAGLDVRLITDGYVAELAPDVTGQWWRAGFQPATAEELMSMGIRLEEAQALKREVGSSARVVSHLKPF